MDDDDRFVSLYKSGKSIKEFTQIFLRNDGAITSRLRKLGMIVKKSRFYRFGGMIAESP